MRGGRKERVWEQRARGKKAGPKRHAFQCSSSPAPNSVPPGGFPALQEPELLRLLVPPAVSAAVASAGSFLRSYRSDGDSPRRRPGTFAHEWDSALSAPSRSREGGGGRPALPRLPAAPGAASWASWWPPSPASLPRPLSPLLAGGAQVACAAASRCRPGRPRDPACARAPDHGGQLRPGAAAAASRRRPQPAPAPPERTRGGSQCAVTSFHGRDGQRGTERAAQHRPGNPYLSCGQELPTAGACEPGVRAAWR